MGKGQKQAKQSGNLSTISRAWPRRPV